MDLIAAAIPGFFATMGIEHAWLRRHADERGIVAGRYERDDTLASLSMGVGSLLVPLAMQRLLRPVTPGRGRYAKVLVGGAVGAAVLTTVADAAVRLSRGEVDAAGALPASPPDASHDEGGRLAPHPTGARSARSRRRRLVDLVRRASGSSAVVAVSAGVVAGSTTWAARTSAARLWRRWGHERDLGTGLVAMGVAILGWDFIYYWNHRLMHSSRYMWAIHVVHHSSQRYNLSTALRQPVAGELGVFVPYGLLALLGVRPSIIQTARDLNLLYQYWIHTEAIGKLGRVEEVLNTASHHRVHHGTNLQYLDRNHGSILIVWDRLFGTFAREEEPVTYGLTRNIDTHNPLRIGTHEHVAMLRDVGRATTWRDRLGFVFRGPGWAYARKGEVVGAAAGAATAA